MKGFSELSCPVVGGMVILEETTYIRIEMFHHGIKPSNQNNFVLISIDLPL